MDTKGEQTMMPAATELVTTDFIFKRNQELLTKAIDGLTDEQWNIRPLDACNSVLWLVGHIVWARSRALQLVGFTWTKPWLVQFARGSKPTESTAYPTRMEMMDAWHDLCSSFPAALGEISHDVLAKPVQQPSPSFDGTVGGMVGFLAMHESYHVGQVVYARRMLGCDEISG
jgi:DinB superfamily